jgi:hypothetical protein
LDKVLQKYYEDRFSMMTTEGWKDLVADAQVMLDTYNTLESVSTEKDLWFKKGQLDILRWLVELKGVSERAWEELNAEKNI